MYKKFNDSSYIEISSFSNSNISFGRSIAVTGDGARVLVGNDMPASNSGYVFVLDIATFQLKCNSVCWSPELGIAAAVANSGADRVMTSSLKGRPPTSYNVFDSSFNSIDESGNWSMKQLTLTDLSSSTSIGSIINSLLARINLLEQTALLRSFDILVAPTSSFSIPVNLAESESIQIDINMLVGGTGGQSVYLKANTSAATNVGWQNYNGAYTYGESGAVAQLEGGNGTGVNNGIIAVSALAGQTIIVSLELFRSFDINTPSQKYYMKTRSLSFFLGNTYGLTKIDSQGAVGNAILTGVTFSVPSGTTLKASYSIIEDRRRTVLDGALS